MTAVDAVLYLSFGGPESMQDVMPFLERVTAGRNIPTERIAEVASQYEATGGKSPINDQNREVIAAVGRELTTRGVDLPIYFGNRNWDPLIEDTLKQMSADGVQHAACFVTSAFSSYSGCRQYKQDIERAQRTIGKDAPTITKVRQFFNHPGFIESMAANLRESLKDLGNHQYDAAIAFTAHSIPLVMAETSRYEAQLQEAARLILNSCGLNNRFDVVFQSRSGPPSVPWLQPDISDHLRAISAEGFTAVAIAPLGFVTDHQEVRYDLDVLAMQTAEELGLKATRVPSVGKSKPFIEAIGDLLMEVIDGQAPKTCGSMGVVSCLGPTCCPPPSRTAHQSAKH